MFCQNCGAELRLEQGFCAICGVSVPAPVLHHEPEDRKNKVQHLNTQPPSKRLPDSDTQPTSGSSLLNPSPTASHAQPNPGQIRTFQAIRQASGQRGSMRSPAPTASLAVPASAPDQPAPAPAPAAQPAPRAPLSAPITVPIPPLPTNGHAAATSAAPAAQDSSQPPLNGYHLIDAAALDHNGLAPIFPADASPTAADFSAPYPIASAPASGLTLPNDIPNRLALSALAGMILSFLLPWVIIGGVRATPLSIGWPILIPLAILIATGCAILLPQRALYTPFILALPFALGCFSLGSALIIFLISSAIAANSVGLAFLGVDIGFALFALTSLILASAGYFKLRRELPLLLNGHIHLAPLPGRLGRLASHAAPRHPASSSPTGSAPRSQPQPPA